MTLGWTGLNSVGGSELVTTRYNTTKIYTRLCVFCRDGSRMEVVVHLMVNSFCCRMMFFYPPLIFIGFV
jgi:hypothetical protein